MLHHPTYDKLNKLRLFGMARALHDQGNLDLDHLGFEERLGLLVDREVTERDGRQLALRLLRANLKPNTVAEDTDYRHARGLDKPLFQHLLAGQWLSEKQNVLLTGPTGVGKTWLACALAHQACRQGYSAYYVRLPRLLDELSLGRADGLRIKLFIALQLPVEHWHGWIGDPTIADAILDRLMHRIHRITLAGDSMRKTAQKTSSTSSGNPTA